MRALLSVTAGTVAVAAFFGVAIWIKVSVWNECRAGDHSVFYCWHLVTD